MSNDFPMYLVDDYEGGGIEERAWVEVTDKTRTEAQAIEWMTTNVEPVDEDTRYEVIGRSHQRPSGFEVEGSDTELRTVKPLSEYPPCKECAGTGTFTGKGHDGTDVEDNCDDCYGTGKNGEFIFDSCEPIPWEECEADHPEAMEFWNLTLTDEPEGAGPPEVSEHQTNLDV